MSASIDDVRPPPWRSWWAYALYSLVASSLVVSFLRAQRRNLELQRAVAEGEREVARDMRELAELKDLLLADRAIELEEREQLIAELRRRNAELARFNYTVSHDLKNPLTTIKTYVGLVSREAAAGGAEHLLRDLARIDAAADRMHRLLEDLLQLSRIGRSAGVREEVPLSQLAGEAAAGVELLAERGIEVEIAPDLPVVRVERPRLLEVLRNLLDNAARYLGDQPTPRIEIGAWLDGDGQTPVVFVRDNGAGIDPRYHENIFRLFERLDSRGEGTGVGLTLAQRIVEVHGGRIWVESEGLGQGSTFCFTLPAPESAERPVPIPSPR